MTTQLQDSSLSTLADAMGDLQVVPVANSADVIAFPAAHRIDADGIWTTPAAGGRLVWLIDEQIVMLRALLVQEADAQYEALEEQVDYPELCDDPCDAEIDEADAAFANAVEDVCARDPYYQLVASVSRALCEDESASDSDRNKTAAVVSRPIGLTDEQITIVRDSLADTIAHSWAGVEDPDAVEQVKRIFEDAQRY